MADIEKSGMTMDEFASDVIAKSVRGGASHADMLTIVGALLEMHRNPKEPATNCAGEAEVCCGWEEEIA